MDGGAALQHGLRSSARASRLSGMRGGASAHSTERALQSTSPWPLGRGRGAALSRRYAGVTELAAHACPDDRRLAPHGRAALACGTGLAIVTHRSSKLRIARNSRSQRSFPPEDMTTAIPFFVEPLAASGHAQHAEGAPSPRGLARPARRRARLKFPCPAPIQPVHAPPIAAPARAAGGVSPKTGGVAPGVSRALGARPG